MRNLLASGIFQAESVAAFCVGSDLLPGSGYGNVRLNTRLANVLVSAGTIVAAWGCSGSGPVTTVKGLVRFAADAPFELGPANSHRVFPIVVKKSFARRYNDVFSSFDTTINAQTCGRTQLFDALPELMLWDLPVVETRSIVSTGPGRVTAVIVRPDFAHFRDRLQAIVRFRAPAREALPSDQEQRAFQDLLSRVRGELLTVDTLYFRLDSSGRIVTYRNIRAIRDSIRTDSVVHAAVSIYGPWLERATVTRVAVKDWSSLLQGHVPSVFVDWDMAAPGETIPAVSDSSVSIGGRCYGVNGTDTTSFFLTVPLEERATSVDGAEFTCAWKSDYELADWRRVRPTELWAQISVNVMGRGESLARTVRVR